MSFDPSIPQANDLISDSQLDLLINFGQLNTQFSINHRPLTDVTSQKGYHTKIFFPSGIGADPNLPAPESALYTKGNPAQLFYQNGALAADVKQLTNITPTNAGSDYFIQTPFGLKFAWGQFTAVGLTATITFQGTFATVHAALGTQIDGSTGGSRACTVKSASLTNTGVQFFVSNNNAQGYYWVLGV